MHRAVAVLAEMHLVQVCLKNLVLAVVAFQQHRHRRSIELAVPGLLAGQEEILDQLLRQRAAALHDVACAQIGDAGTKNRLDADAGMRSEEHTSELQSLMRST